MPCVTVCAVQFTFSATHSLLDFPVWVGPKAGFTLHGSSDPIPIFIFFSSSSQVAQNQACGNKSGMIVKAALSRCKCTYQVWVTFNWTSAARPVVQIQYTCLWSIQNETLDTRCHTTLSSQTDSESVPRSRVSAAKDDHGGVTFSVCDWESPIGPLITAWA